MEKNNNNQAVSALESNTFKEKMNGIRKDTTSRIKNAGVAVTKKELELLSRGITFPVLISAINTIIFIFGLANVFIIVNEMRQTLEPNYGKFLYLYALMAFVVFVILLIISPIFGAPAISAERERRTFDLLFTTLLTPMDIVAEKMLSAFISVVVIAFSCIPALCLTLIFGGVSFLDVFILFISFLPGIFLMLSASMFAGSVAFNATRGIALGYALCMGLLLGPVLISMLMGRFSVPGTNQLAYLMLIDPLYTFVAVIGPEMGEGDLVVQIMQFLNLDVDAMFVNFSALISVTVQIALGLGFILLSVMNIMPGGILPRNLDALEKR